MRLSIGGNPSSVHGAGRAARAIVERAREQVAALAGARAQDVIFTSGGTEANALALWGAVQGAAEAGARITRLFVSAIEHDSVLPMPRPSPNACQACASKPFPSPPTASSISKRCA